MKNYLDINNVDFFAGDSLVLENISLSIPKKGDCICLLGPSGIGKTTVLRAIAGLIKIPIGSIVLKEKVLNNNNIFVCGNGGAASVSNHLLCDFNKGIKNEINR